MVICFLWNLASLWKIDWILEKFKKREGKHKSKDFNQGSDLPHIITMNEDNHYKTSILCHSDLIYKEIKVVELNTLYKCHIKEIFKIKLQNSDSQNRIKYM